MTTYQGMYRASWVVGIALIFCNSVPVIGPERLGIGDIPSAWIALFALILSGVVPFLPPWQRPPVKDDDPRGSTRDPQPRDE